MLKIILYHELLSELAEVMLVSAKTFEHHNFSVFIVKSGNKRDHITFYVDFVCFKSFIRRRGSIACK